MSSDALTVNITTEADFAEVHMFGYSDDDQGATHVSVDVRRKLEDKLEELRLQRDLKEFDFDF